MNMKQANLCHQFLLCERILICDRICYRVFLVQDYLNCESWGIVKCTRNVSFLINFRKSLIKYSDSASPHWWWIRSFSGKTLANTRPSCKGPLASRPVKKRWELTTSWSINISVDSGDLCAYWWEQSERTDLNRLLDAPGIVVCINDLVAHLCIS